VAFARNEPSLLPGAALAVASALSFLGVDPLGLRKALAGFEAVAQFGPGDGPIDSLRPFALAAHLGARGRMTEPHGGRSLVHLLSAGTGTAHEAFGHLLRPDAEGGQSLADFGW